MPEDSSSATAEDWNHIQICISGLTVNIFCHFHIISQTDRADFCNNIRESLKLHYKINTMLIIPKFIELLEAGYIFIFALGPEAWE